jgi:hypothetical protein
VDSSGPASSTPVSSKSSRIAAQISAIASGSLRPSRAAHSLGDGPYQATSPATSRWSTEPPGKAYMPGANAIVAARLTAYTSKSPGGPDRNRITVAA